MSDLSTLKLSHHPFPGLRAYEYTEYDIFFGRKQQVDEMLGILESHHFLAVVGPSGCGKSSLVRAGLRPALTSGRMPSAGSRWSVAIVRPGNQPFETLARELCRIEPFLENSNYEHYEASFLCSLRRDPYGLIDEWSNLDSVNENAEENAPPLNLLLIIDQFEEVFRFDTHDNANEYREFVSLLLTTASEAQKRSLSIYVVLTMRSDFLGHCPQFTGLPEALNSSQYLTPRLSREQIRQAIVGPLALRESTIEPRVVNEILNDMGTDPDQLPLMQHLMLRMWRHFQLSNASDSEREEIDDSARVYDIVESSIKEISYRGDIHLDYAVYEAVGKLNGALEKHLDGVFEKRLTSERQQLTAEYLFRSLTTITPEGQMIRSPTRLKDIPRPDGVSMGQLRDVIEVFRAYGRHFLTPPVPHTITPETFIDITHESLIRKWNRLNAWTRDEAKRKKVERRTREKFETWKTDPNNPNTLLYGSDLAEALELFKKRGVVSLSTGRTFKTDNWLGNDQSQFRSGVSSEMQAYLIRSEEKRDEAAHVAAEKKFLGKMKKLTRLASGFAVVAACLAVIALWLMGQEKLTNQKLNNKILELNETNADLTLKNKTNLTLGLIRNANLATQSPQLQLLLNSEAMRTAAGIGDPKLRPSLMIPPETNASLVEINSSTDVITSLRQALTEFESFGLSSSVLGRLDDWIDSGTSPTPVRVSGIKVLSWTRPNDPEQHHWLATGTNQGSLLLWNLDARQHAKPQIFREQSEGRITKIAFRSPPESSNMPPLVVWGDQYGRMWLSEYDDTRSVFGKTKPIWDPSGKSVNHEITDISFSPNGRWLVAANKAGELRIWDAFNLADVNIQNSRTIPFGGNTADPPLNEIQEIPQTVVDETLPTAVEDILFVAKGGDTVSIPDDVEYLVAVGAQGNAEIWKLTGNDSEHSFKRFATMNGHHVTITDVDESANGAWLATADTSGQTMLWNLTDALKQNPPPGMSLQLDPIIKPPTQEQEWGVTFATRQITFGPGNETSGDQVPPWLFVVNDSVVKGGSVAEYYSLDYEKWSPEFWKLWTLKSWFNPNRGEANFTAYNGSNSYPLFVVSPTDHVTQIFNSGHWFAAITERGKVNIKYFLNLPLASASFAGVLPEIEIRGHDGPILEAQFFTNSNDLTTAPVLVTVGSDNQIRVWDLSQRKCRFETPLNEFPQATTNSPDGARFATLARTNDELTRAPTPEFKISIWTESDHKLHPELEDFVAINSSALLAFLFDRDNSLVAIFEDGEIYRWQKSGEDGAWTAIKSNLNISLQTGSRDATNQHIALKEDRQVTAKSAYDGRICLSGLKRSTNELILIQHEDQGCRFTLPQSSVNQSYFLDFAMHPNSNQVALALSDGRVALTSLETDPQIQSQVLALNEPLIGASFNRNRPLNLGDLMLCFDRSGSQLFVASSDGSIRRFDVRSGKEIETVLKMDILQPQKNAVRNLVQHNGSIYRISALNDQAFSTYGILDIISLTKKNKSQAERVFDSLDQQIGFNAADQVVLTHRNGTRHYIRLMASPQSGSKDVPVIAKQLLEQAQAYAGRNLTLAEWNAAFNPRPKDDQDQVKRQRTFPDFR